MRKDKKEEEVESNICSAFRHLLIFSFFLIGLVFVGQELYIHPTRFHLPFHSKMNRLLLILVALQLIGFLSVSALFKSSPKLKHATKFRLKQKVLTLGSSYTIEDEHGKPAYKVKTSFY